VPGKVRLRRCSRTGRRLRIGRGRRGRGWNEPALFRYCAQTGCKCLLSSREMVLPVMLLLVLDDVPDVDEMQWVMDITNE